MYECVLLPPCLCFSMAFAALDLLPLMSQNQHHNPQNICLHRKSVDLNTTTQLLQYLSPQIQPLRRGKLEEVHSVLIGDPCFNRKVCAGKRQRESKASFSSFFSRSQGEHYQKLHESIQRETGTPKKATKPPSLSLKFQCNVEQDLQFLWSWIKKLIHLLRSVRSKGSVINIHVVRAAAKAVILSNTWTSQHLLRFNMPPSWVHSIYKCMGLSKRMGTTARPPVPQ